MKRFMNKNSFNSFDSSNKFEQIIQMKNPNKNVQIELNVVEDLNDSDLTDDVFLIDEPSNRDNDLSKKNQFTKPNIRKDLHNIIFLMFLYLLQGVPLGLTGSVPFLLSSRKVSYSDQGTFSLAFWPFGLKLLWAPIVDSIYFKKIGRRKSWLVPMQYTIGTNLIKKIF